MAHDPLDVIAECLGQPADQMRNPIDADNLCPFVSKVCHKYNRQLGVPAPVCSVYRRGSGRQRSPRDTVPICLCPTRFYEADIVGDIIRECWVGPKPTNQMVAKEVQMEKFGKVDLVVADLNDEGTAVKTFLPVELQAVDITGSYLPYYRALVASRMAPSSSNYGFNWANVRKRFISQLIAKGYYCHHWGTRIVAVVQEDLFAEFTQHARIVSSPLEQSNIVFMLYQYKRDEPSGPWILKLQSVVSTTHTSVMQAILYELPPNKSKFESKILAQYGQY